MQDELDIKVQVQRQLVESGNYEKYVFFSILQFHDNYRIEG